MSVPRNPAELLIRGRPLTLASVADGAEALVVADLARGLAVRPDATAISLAVLCRDGPRMAAKAAFSCRDSATWSATAAVGAGVRPPTRTRTSRSPRFPGS